MTMVMTERLSRLWQWEPLKRALSLYLVARVGLSLWGVFLLIVMQAGSLSHLQGAPASEVLTKLLLEPWGRFDTGHYIRLAERGYYVGSPDTVFLPLYPLLIRVVASVLGGRYLLAALFVSNLCALGYFVVFFVLAEQEFGAEAARKAQLYAVCYPWALFLLAGYTEALSLFLITLAFLMVHRGRGWWAGLFGMLAALTRLQGGLLTIPLLFEALRRRRFKLLPIKLDLVWPMLPAIASAGFLVGRAVAGFEPLNVTFAVYWGHALAFPWVGVLKNVRNMVTGVAQVVDYMDFLAALFIVVLTVVAWRRRLAPKYVIYMSVVMLFNLAHLRTTNPMCSVGRHTVEVFPAFMLLGQWGSSKPWVHRCILYPFLALYLFLSGVFLLGGWVG
jgi:Gpi18-like mannosyltransferase